MHQAVGFQILRETVFGFHTFFFHGNPSVTIFWFCKIDDYWYPYLQWHNKLNLLLKVLTAELPCIFCVENEQKSSLHSRSVTSAVESWFLLHAAFLFMGNGISFPWLSQHGNDTLSVTIVTMKSYGLCMYWLFSCYCFKCLCGSNIALTTWIKYSWVYHYLCH